MMPDDHLAIVVWQSFQRREQPRLALAPVEVVARRSDQPAAIASGHVVDGDLATDPSLGGSILSAVVGHLMPEDHPEPLAPLGRRLPAEPLHVALGQQECLLNQVGSPALGLQIRIQLGVGDQQ